MRIAPPVMLIITPVGMIPFFGSHIPLGTVVDFVVLPIFIVIVVSQRRVWT